MAVYVDRLKRYPRRVREWAHLWADDLQELHAFARGALLLKRRWFQTHRFLPHYDVTASKRREAIRRGAVQMEVLDWKRAQRKQSDDTEG